ncbi:M23 family metallopeptidase [Puteibacter caeruleilacunae]|nr:M23 family metallopeptidase [Puteibacter caeruleilacunae]
MSFKLSRIGVFTSVVLFTIVVITIISLLISFTPLREYIPGYPSGKMRKQIVENALRVDSLEEQLRMKDEFINKIQVLIKGEVPEETDQLPDTSIRLSQVEFKTYNHDSIFQDKIQEEKFNLSLFDQSEEETKISDVHFFVPVKGVITKHFKATPEHLGVDIVAEEFARISSILDGTVVFAGWTTDGGYVIQLQHENNLISIYKHNSELLKKQGDRVQAGEAIAIMGNSGEMTTGSHLHLEMWFQGTAIDPEKYIDF